MNLENWIEWEICVSIELYFDWWMESVFDFESGFLKWKWNCDLNGIAVNIDWNRESELNTLLTSRAESDIVGMP